MRCPMITIKCDAKGCMSRYTPDPADEDPERSAQVRGWKCVDGNHHCPAHAIASPKEPAPTEYRAG